MRLTPGRGCWLSDQVEVRPSGIAGQGLFANTDIGAGVVVSRLGGRIVSNSGLQAMLQSAGDTYVDAVSVFKDGNLVLPPGTTNHFGNHSCQPNLWWVEPFSLATRSLIPAGDELTVDYATLTARPDFQMRCACRASCCRGLVTGADWMLADLQERYGDHWVPVLRNQIRART